MARRLAIPAQIHHRLHEPFVRRVGGDLAVPVAASIGLAGRASGPGPPDLHDSADASDALPSPTRGLAGADSLGYLGGLARGRVAPGPLRSGEMSDDWSNYVADAGSDPVALGEATDTMGDAIADAQPVLESGVAHASSSLVARTALS